MTVIMLSFIMLSVVMLSVIMLTVIVLNVVATNLTHILFSVLSSESHSNPDDSANIVSTISSYSNHVETEDISEDNLPNNNQGQML